MGAVEDLTATVQGKVEVIWQGTQIPASMKALGAECHVTGDTVRAVLPENQQDAAIDALRRERIRLIAITPLRTSLEAYFVEKLQQSQVSPRRRQWGPPYEPAHRFTSPPTRFAKRSATACSTT